jgi:uncharacterized membrane protein
MAQAGFYHQVWYINHQQAAKVLLACCHPLLVDDVIWCLF